jgi:hypothetical protein
MAREINQSEPEIASDASGRTSKRIRTSRGRHQADVLMAHQNFGKL